MAQQTPQVLPAGQISQLRVSKKLSIRSRGALKLAARFGEALVCVRHRVDPGSSRRYTTVELLVEHAEIRSRGTRLVQIRVHSHEVAARALVRAAGGVCDSRTGLWTLPKAAVVALKMTARIVDRK